MKYNHTPYREYLETVLERKYIARPKTAKKYEPISLLEIAIVTILSGLSIGLVVSIILLSV